MLLLRTEYETKIMYQMNSHGFRQKKLLTVQILLHLLSTWTSSYKSRISAFRQCNFKFGNLPSLSKAEFLLLPLLHLRIFPWVGLLSLPFWGKQFTSKCHYNFYYISCHSQRNEAFLTIFFIIISEIKTIPPYCKITEQELMDIYIKIYNGNFPTELFYFFL